MNQQQKVQFAAGIALIIHAVGVVGMLYFDRTFFASLTPYNLLLSLALLLWTQTGKNRHFYLFFMVCFVTGIVTEYLGVNYQLLFGHYQYGTPLGWQVGGVPLLIGVNWFTVMLCSGVTVQTLLNGIWNQLRQPHQLPRINVGRWAIVLDGALLATAFDWLMEPVAVQLNFWTWAGGGDAIPLSNYLTWFFVSAGLLYLFRHLSFPKTNQFAVHLLVIQSLFFFILRIWL